MAVNNLYRSTDFLGKALDATLLRNELISANIANADTPNYKRKDVAFESFLNKAIQNNGKIDMEALGRANPKVYTDKGHLSYRLDNNNVDIDTEMVYLAENQIRYNTLVSQVSYNFERLNMVMNR